MVRSPGGLALVPCKDNPMASKPLEGQIAGRRLIRDTAEPFIFITFTSRHPLLCPGVPLDLLPPSNF
ncbi:hypothetical protein VN97_g3504 [Penicillium thymicola]|uniref:Uncharacterized protein n=1 Tax=Penicillium thymicola TaxID=293382 RepID=A0AAI9XAR5_PENTH|nr:hypothetical protein VN97_g3504 [Penicillium thymicola]